MNKNVEYRNSGEIRADKESRLVEGCAIKFNSQSVDLGWIETILPEAIDEDVIKRSDIFAVIDHNKEHGVLARSRYGNGTLKLEIREDGLYYSFNAPNYSVGDELLSYLQRGEITQSSFGFWIDKNDGDEWTRDADGTIRRTIKKIYALTDVSPVFQPAYEETTASTRKFDEAKSRFEKLANDEVYFS